MKCVYLFLIFCFLNGTALAQQLPLFTQYRDHQSFINPAMLSSDYLSLDEEFTNSIGLSYRHQWSELEDAPRSLTARYEHISEKNNMALGGHLLKEETGPTGVSGAYLRYAYQTRFNEETFLSIGLSAGLMQYRFRGSQGDLRDPNDWLGMSDYNSLIADVNLGAFFFTTLYNNDKVYIGLSMPQVLASQIMNDAEDIDITDHRKTHFYGNVGMYKYLEGSDNMFLEPSIWIKYVPNAPLQIDANLRFQMSELFWIGTGYSISTDSKLQGNHLHLEAGFILGEIAGLFDKKLKIAYGFDRGLTVWGPKFGNTHELSLSFLF